MSTAFPSDAGPEPTRIISVAKITRGHSCALCQQRKVRCDGQRPCSNCVKARVECKTSEATSRRKRKLPEEDILARLKRYEDVIIKHGLKVEDGDGVGGEPSGEHRTSKKTSEAYRSSYASEDDGKLIVERGHSRYIESRTWTALSDEIQSSIYTHNGSSEDDAIDSHGRHYLGHGSLLFRHPTINDTLFSSHPEPVQIFRLWQAFVDNVNPLVKILHVPTVQQLIVEASGSLENISASMEALMFAIYHSSLVSLRNEDCESIMGEARATLLARYSTATQQALTNAGVLRTSNLMVLQALLLYLLSIRQYCDPDTLWIFAGVAVRIGQRIGLHRESDSLKISIFENEIRRRLWLQILILDNKSAQMSGTAAGVYDSSEALWRPLNINDCDLYPSMKELPAEHTGVTEMLFCCIRYEVGLFMRQSESWRVSEVSVIVKDKAIDELENRLDQKYLKYCDPSIPLHLLSSLMAKTAICRMRLMAHHPRHKSADMPRSEKDMLFSLSLKMIEYDSISHASEDIRRYLWHVNVFFQVEALIYILSELCYRPSGELVDRAWQQVGLAYDNHPDMVSDTHNLLYLAIGDLALKAWEKRADGTADTNGIYQMMMTPRFISSLKSRRESKAAQNATTQWSVVAPRDRTSNFEGKSQANVADRVMNRNQLSGIGIGSDPSSAAGDIGLDISHVDWDLWQTLLEGSEPLMFDGSGRQLFR
ncbi:fungal-specific transcription factor domain-containing protein [Lipomyces kononenkoae]|uniref:Fungal-specific transcription factor domain-containing protein n=1 Tax=Lipomyces kononenkoae TaxID=34357 RepID=A0ACC3T299_LIPKO